MKEGIHLASPTEPSVSSLVAKELSTLDRQYSYEHTIQLGRYRLEPEEAASERTAATAKKLQAEAVEQKKSVRFNDFDPREIWKEEKRARTWGAQFKRWKAQISPSISFAMFRMMLVDWVYLAILGIGMALLSLAMDNMIKYMQTFQQVLMTLSGRTGSAFLDYLCTYLTWLGYTELLVICSAMFVHYVAPQAIGSGIPEMKTILRGVILKDYLTLKTLISKVVGLTFSLGSGIPIGKMGPFVHIASIAANLLGNVAANVDGAYGNECRKSEMLAAACAVGVACTFSAPVGGVLFSIEVTTMYFSVRNYWRGFFAAACGAIFLRLLPIVWFRSDVTLLAFYQTHFPKDGFEAEELPFFALIGLFAGFIGVLFITFYRTVVMFLRQNHWAKKFFQRNWIVYPIVVSFIVASITYPRGYGRFLTGRFKFSQTLLDFFSNCTWSKPIASPDSPHGCSSELIASWTNHEGYGPYSIYLVLTLFGFTFLFLSALCNTMPIPCGMLMPIFVVGAAFGRLFGEIISTTFPEGIPGGTDQPIFPGIYSVVGAAALSGSITHSVSVAVICCEMTGQYIFIIPLMLAVIIANAVSTYFTPSIYDCIINIKHLPYLPDIPPSNAAVHMFCAEHIMVSPVRYLPKLTTYEEIKNILIELPKLRSFPVVDDSSSMLLLGSIARRSLLELIAKQIGDDERKREAERRIRLAIETIDRHFREAQLNVINDEDEEEEEVPELKPKRPTDLPLKSVGWKSPDFDYPEEHVESEDPKLSRVMSDDVLTRPVAQVRPRKTSECFEERPIDPDLQKKKKKSRFTIEPVTPVDPPKTEKTKEKKRQSSLKVIRRRNAFSSVSLQGKADDYEEDEDKIGRLSRSNSGTITPSPKNSWPDLIKDKFHGDSNSITRNIAEYVKHARKRFNFSKIKADEHKIEYDLFEDERKEWELERLKDPVELDESMIDPAPFQLVRKTSLYKVHSLFSLLDLNRAYVTERGRLVGVVALRDLRIAIQQAANGAPPVKKESVEFIEESAMQSPDDMEKGNINFAFVRKKTDHPTLVHHFSAGIERKRTEVEKEPEHDILTPALKVVHPSAASLHHFYNHPLLTIQEEDAFCSSQNSTIVDSANSSLPRPSILKSSEEQNIFTIPHDDEVAQAVAYLRRRSVSTEYMNCDNEKETSEK